MSLSCSFLFLFVVRPGAPSSDALCSVRSVVWGKNGKLVAFKKRPGKRRRPANDVGLKASAGARCAVCEMTFQRIHQSSMDSTSLYTVMLFIHIYILYAQVYTYCICPTNPIRLVPLVIRHLPARSSQIEVHFNPVEVENFDCAPNRGSPLPTDGAVRHGPWIDVDWCRIVSNSFLGGSGGMRD